MHGKTTTTSVRSFAYSVHGMNLMKNLPKTKNPMWNRWKKETSTHDTKRELYLTFIHFSFGYAIVAACECVCIVFYITWSIFVDSTANAEDIIPLLNNNTRLLIPTGFHFHFRFVDFFLVSLSLRHVCWIPCPCPWLTHFSYWLYCYIYIYICINCCCLLPRCVRFRIVAFCVYAFLFFVLIFVFI